MQASQVCLAQSALAVRTTALLVDFSDIGVRMPPRFVGSARHAPNRPPRHRCPARMSSLVMVGMYVSSDSLLPTTLPPAKGPPAAEPRTGNVTRAAPRGTAEHGRPTEPGRGYFRPGPRLPSAFLVQWARLLRLAAVSGCSGPSIRSRIGSSAAN